MPRVHLTFACGDYDRTRAIEDGSVQVERLVEERPDDRAYCYEMVSTGMPVENYAAELRVEDMDGRTSRVRWHAAFEVTSGDEASVVAGIRAFLRAGLENLANRVGRQPANG